jgi:hypothetical protein
MYGETGETGVLQHIDLDFAEKVSASLERR